jgi:hypothetical protein
MQFSGVGMLMSVIRFLQCRFPRTLPADVASARTSGRSSERITRNTSGLRYLKAAVASTAYLPSSTFGDPGVIARGRVTLV